MYMPFRRRSTHFQELSEVFGKETAIALCRQLAPKGDRRRIPIRPNARLINDLGDQSHHAERLCYYFPDRFIYFPRLIEAALFDSISSGMTWEELCDRYQLKGKELTLLLGDYLDAETRRRVFPKITREMNSYLSHQQKVGTG